MIIYYNIMNLNSVILMGIMGNSDRTEVWRVQIFLVFKLLNSLTYFRLSERKVAQSASLSAIAMV